MAVAAVNRLILPAPAKLNLFLHITGRREDGYHNLQTVFQLLDYGDELQFESRRDSAIRLNADIPGLATQDNLVARAACLLQRTTHTNYGASILLRKRLPLGGGIGGGSSDAGTTLLALNRLWHLNLTTAQLAELGRQLGADVPVFVYGHSAWAEGVGEQLQALQLPSFWYLVIVPDCQISTARIFAHKDLTRDTRNITVAAFLEQGGRNDCQKLVRSLYPEVDQALCWLDQFGHARMTGTGACVFASFDSKADADNVLQQLPPGMRGFVARGVNQSPAHQLLASHDFTGV